MASQTWTTHAQIIDAIGVAVMRDTLGIPDTHVRTMKVRNSIPMNYWGATIRAAETAGVSGVTSDVLSAIALEQSQRRAADRKQARAEKERRAEEKRQARQARRAEKAAQSQA